jgi:CheY-like chemotaxis protein
MTDLGIALIAGQRYLARSLQQFRRQPSTQRAGAANTHNGTTLALDPLTMASMNASPYFGTPGEIPTNATEMFDLPQLIGDVCKSCQPVAAGKNIQLIVTIEHGAPRRIHAMARDLRQILASLTNVSLTLTAPDGVVEVTLHHLPLKDETANRIRLSIADSGPALSAKAIDTLFHPFGLDDFSSNRIPASLGLHPYMARQFAARYGGHVDYAVQDRGGCFTIEFPTYTWNVAATENEPGNVAQAFSDCFEQHRAALSPKRILVVEDQITSQQILIATLESAGHEVTLAATGHAALGCLDEQCFDAMLLDLGLPGLGGIEVLKFKRLSVNAATPCIVISGDVSPESRRAAKELGAAAFLTKPVHIRSLLETLVQTIDQVPAALEKEGATGQ